LLPIGLADEVKLKNDIKVKTPLCLQDVEFSGSHAAILALQTIEKVSSK
tara:strand:+ start:414 stop:560 length:147 start_codon:yes stop_codon:yes gene_type:complete